MLTAGEFCNRHVVFALADEPVTTAARLMREHHVGSVVVVAERAEGRVPVGLLTDRDIVVGLVAVSPERLMNTLVRDLARREPVVASVEESVYEVMLRMRGHGVRRVPVVDAGGILQGIIVFDDLVEYVAEQMSKLVALIEREQSKERDLRPASASPGRERGPERPVRSLA